MQEITWPYYPRVAAHPVARAFVESQARHHKSPKTVDAYARNLDDLLQAWAGREPDGLLEAGPEAIEVYIDGLSTRAPRTPGNKTRITRLTGTMLAPATIQQRVVTVRLFFDFCIARGFRADPQHPVPRGRQGYGRVPPRRGPFPQHRHLAWIPPDDVWERIVTHVVRHESLRNQVMVLLAYDGALRRQELVGLRRDDLDLGAGLVTVRSALSKTGLQRTVTFSAATGALLTRYLHQDRAHLLAAFGGHEEGPLFLSESPRNPGAPLCLGSFNDVIARIRQAVGVPQLTPHTLRHLRCTVLKRCNVELQDIALYAGHVSVVTTQLYIHLAPSRLATVIREKTAPFDARMHRLLRETEIHAD